MTTSQSMDIFFPSQVFQMTVVHSLSMDLFRLSSRICHFRPKYPAALNVSAKQFRCLRTRPVRARVPQRTAAPEPRVPSSHADELVAYDDIFFNDAEPNMKTETVRSLPSQNTARSLETHPRSQHRRQILPEQQVPQPQRDAQDPAVLSSETLNTYNIALPPSRSQLAQAGKFFTRTPPTLLYSAGKFHECPRDSIFPEVAFLGRSNVGKSSLFNALLNRSASAPAHVSSRPGKTKTLNGFSVGGPGIVGAAPSATRRTVEGKEVPAKQRDEVWKRMGPGGLVIVDMPGYGGGSREEWGKAVLMFLKERKQLRRAFLLIDAAHGPKATDLELLRYLQSEGISWQVVLSKVDKTLMKHGKAPKSAEGMGRRLTELQTLKEKYTGMIQDALVGKSRSETRSPAQPEEPDDALAVLAPKKKRKGERRIGMDILCCSSEKSIEGAHRKIGINELRWAIMTACGIEAVD